MCVPIFGNVHRFLDFNQFNMFDTLYETFRPQYYKRQHILPTNKMYAAKVTRSYIMFMGFFSLTEDDAMELIMQTISPLNRQAFDKCSQIACAQQHVFQNPVLYQQNCWQFAFAYCICW